MRSPTMCAPAALLLLCATARAQDYTINLPLPSDPGVGGGDVTRFTLSPNGTKLAYIADGDTPDVFELYAVALDGARVAHRLSPAQSAPGSIDFFTFTPDSTRVVFVGDIAVFQQYELYSAPVDGSAPPVRLHGALPAGGDVGDLAREHPLVIGNGGRVVFAGDLEVDGQYQLYSAPADGSAPPVHLNGPLAPNRDVNNEFLLLTPDGSRVLYFSDEASDELYDLWSVPVDGSAPPTRLVQSFVSTNAIGGEGGPAVRFTPDGSEIVFRGDLSDDGVYELFRVSTAGGGLLSPEFDLPPSYSDIMEFALTPDGGRVLARMDRSSNDVFELWSVPTHGGAPAVKLSGPMPVNGDVDGAGSLDGPFQISPDGARVVYRADQTANDRFELFSAPVDGSAPTVRLTTLPPNRSVTDYRISPDSRWVVYRSNQRDIVHDELFVVSITGGAPQRLSGPLVAGGKVQRDFRVGAERVVFRVDAAVDERFELFSAPLVGYSPPLRDLAGVVHLSGPTRLNLPLGASSDVDLGLTLTADGLSVLYVADQAYPLQKEVFRSPLDGATAPVVESGVLTAGPPVGDVAAFGFAGARMVYTANQDDPQVGELYSVSLDSEPLRVKLHDHAVDGGNVNGSRIAPDGQRVVYRADAHGLSKYSLISVPADGSAAPLELSGPITPSGGSVVDTFRFTPDSARVVYLGNLQLVDVLELYSAPLDGSAPQVKLNPPLSGAKDVQSDFQCSPDGQWVVYRADQDTDEMFELYAVPSDGSAPAHKVNGPLVADGDVLGDTNAPEDEIRISADSTHVVFGADAAADGVLELFAAPLDGSAPAWRLHPALGATRDADLMALTPDGQTVLFRTDALLDETFDLYAVPIDASQPPIRLTSSPPTGDGVLRCVVTPDGSRAVFVGAASRGRHHSVFSVPIDGSAGPLEIGEQTTSNYAQIVFLRLAPDGQRVVYEVSGGGEDAVYTAWLDGSHAPVELAQFGAFYELGFAADDTLVCRARELYSGATELFRVPLLGTSAPVRLHVPLAIGRDVTSFQLDATGERVLFRADLAADERFELFLTLLGTIRGAQ